MDQPESLITEFKRYRFDELSVGMSESYSKTISADDVQLFADLTGDLNPVHLDDAFAATTALRRRVAHGMLTAALISTVLGTKLPGPGCIYLEQQLSFKAPVRIGDTVTARVTVAALNAENRRVTVDTTCTVRDRVVLDGTAVVTVPANRA